MAKINSIPLDKDRAKRRAAQEKKVVSMTASQHAQQIARERAVRVRSRHQVRSVG